MAILVAILQLGCLYYADKLLILHITLSFLFDCSLQSNVLHVPELSQLAAETNVCAHKLYYEAIMRLYFLKYLCPHNHKNSRKLESMETDWQIPYLVWP